MNVAQSVGALGATTFSLADLLQANAGTERSIATKRVHIGKTTAIKWSYFFVYFLLVGHGRESYCSQMSTDNTKALLSR